jgi:hypothetical protein
MTGTGHIVSFAHLAEADLRLDVVYQGGRRKNASDDPLPRLLRVSNSGGFRYRGSVDHLEFLVLTTSFSEPDWPDSLDLETGIFTYYGDNRKHGRDLHKTPRNGNEILRRIFESAHAGMESRRQAPPIFLFGSIGVYRDMTFLGLAVPGVRGLDVSEDLLAVWKTSEGKRFQNYRASFTVLDVPVVSRSWIADLLDEKADSANAPQPWQIWVETGVAKPLITTRTLEYRLKAEQLPKSEADAALVRTVQQYFQRNPHGFEHCAAAIAKLLLPDVTSLNVTRPSRDGGRDGIGQFRIGDGASSIAVDFALEAKCKGISNGVGVKDVSRLISRLRHRQFGILVTTSFVGPTAYKEIKDDGHPIIVLAAADIAKLLRKQGLDDPRRVKSWLERDFPRT